MQKEKGKAFIDFITAYCRGKNDVGEENMYHLPSEWWEKVVDASKPSPQEVEIMIQILTIQRNEFICKSINVDMFILTADLPT